MTYIFGIGTLMYSPKKLLEAILFKWIFGPKH